PMIPTVMSPPTPNFVVTGLPSVTAFGLDRPDSTWSVEGELGGPESAGPRPPSWQGSHPLEDDALGRGWDSSPLSLTVGCRRRGAMSARERSLSERQSADSDAVHGSRVLPGTARPHARPNACVVPGPTPLRVAQRPPLPRGHRGHLASLERAPHRSL